METKRETRGSYPDLFSVLIIGIILTRRTYPLNEYMLRSRRKYGKKTFFQLNLRETSCLLRVLRAVACNRSRVCEIFPVKLIKIKTE